MINFTGVLRPETEDIIMKIVKRIEDINQTKGEVYVEDKARIVRVVDLRKLVEMGVENIMWIAVPLENGCHALMEVESYV